MCLCSCYDNYKELVFIHYVRIHANNTHEISWQSNQQGDAPLAQQVESHTCLKTEWHKFLLAWRINLQFFWKISQVHSIYTFWDYEIG